MSTLDIVSLLICSPLLINLITSHLNEINCKLTLKGLYSEALDLLRMAFKIPQAVLLKLMTQ